MNIIGKIGAVLLICGALIINGLVIMTILRLIFKTSIPLYVYLVLAIVVIGLVLMLLSAVRDRYRSAKTEQIHEKY